VAIAGACWAVTVERMQGMDAGPGTNLGGLGWFVVVWVTMMAAMMLPSLSPMAVAAGRGQARSLARTVMFAAGYLLCWLVFGVLAYALFEGVRSLDLGFLVWGRAGRYLAGGVILAAALYELTTPKGGCLQRCRDSRLLRRRPSATMMGVEQGGFCVGCSGALMAALFALGVMSIGWMAIIAALIAIEKLLPWKAAANRGIAIFLLVLGIAVAASPEDVPGLTLPGSPAAMEAMESMGMEGDSMKGESMPQDSMKGESMPQDSMKGESMPQDSMKGESMRR
jgi:pentapeptide MXKDX repeat protein